MSDDTQPRPTPLRIAVLGSGKGSTASAILAWERGHTAGFQTTCLICTSRASGLVGVGAEYGVPVHVIPYDQPPAFADRLISVLEEESVDLLVLAGFTRLLPASVIAFMNGHVINTHPALLPRHGGPGMFGLRVHQAVLEAGDTETGVSVHYVTDRYDEGTVIAQRRVVVHPDDSPEALQDRVKQVEGGFLAETIEQLSATIEVRSAESG